MSDEMHRPDGHEKGDGGDACPRTGHAPEECGCDHHAALRLEWVLEASRELCPKVNLYQPPIVWDRAEG